MKIKIIHCAQCGMELELRRKAVPSEKRIYEVVEPHTCVEGETTLGQITDFATETTFEQVIDLAGAKKPFKPDLDQLFESFKFVKKLNKLATKPSPIQQETGDKRNKDDLRKELLTSNAPVNLLSNIKNLPNSQAENDVSVEPKGE